MNKSIIILNFLALALIGALLFLISTERGKVLAAKTELHQLELRVDQASEYRRVLSSMEPESLKLSSYFVSQDRVPFFIEDLERLATSTKVSLELNQAELVDNKLRFELAATGSFSQIAQFIISVENSPYEITFNTLRFSKIEKGWRANANIELLSYRHD